MTLRQTEQKGIEGSRDLGIEGSRSPADRRSAFTLIELLVVIGVIALLVSVLMVAGGSVFDDAKARQTKASVLQPLDLAIRQFDEDGPLKRVTDYVNRYDDYPCDELDGFMTGVGIPGTAPPVLIGPGAGSNLNLPSGVVEHRDIKAMVLAINLYSPTAKAILEQIPGSYRRAPTDADEFFSRNGDANLDLDDVPLVYYVDTWGNPIEYYATQSKLATEIGPARARLSQYITRINLGKPLLISYGFDGADQFAQLQPGESPLLVDFFSDDPHVIDDPRNQNNVYLDDRARDRLAEGVPDDEIDGDD